MDLKKTAAFSESIIREMTRKAMDYGAVNLSQGLPDIPTPPEVVEAGVRAVREGHNQYSYTWGVPEFRSALARDLKGRKNLVFDPESEIVITCGNSEALMDTVIALAQKGDRICIVEPFYENYLPATMLAGAQPVFAQLADDNSIDEGSFKKAFEKAPTLLLLNTPHNPTGKVYTQQELSFIASLCEKYGTVAVTDETYEHIIYNDKRHLALGAVPGMEDRTVTTSSFGKTFCVTGWRVGYAAACEKLMGPIRKVHDFTTICAPTPFQYALAELLENPGGVYRHLLDQYQPLGEWFTAQLRRIGFDAQMPDGAYYVAAGFSAFGFTDDYEFADYLVKEIGVAVVPGSSFFKTRRWPKVRFTFSRKRKTLEAAVARLEKLKPV